MRLLFIGVLLTVAVPKNALGSWCHFWKGRRSTGNVGEPDQGLPDMQEIQSPPEQFVQQPLDHFNATNTELWKQVYTLLHSYLNYCINNFPWYVSDTFTIAPITSRVDQCLSCFPVRVRLAADGYRKELGHIMPRITKRFCSCWSIDSMAKANPPSMLNILITPNQHLKMSPSETWQRITFFGIYHLGKPSRMLPHSSFK